MIPRTWVIGDAVCPYRFVFRGGVHEGMITLKIHDAKTGEVLLPHENPGSKSIGFTTEQCADMREIFSSVHQTNSLDLRFLEMLLTLPVAERSVLAKALCIGTPFNVVPR